MPEKNNIKSKKGFTIIEVVLVLAIAGLIFLMVFIALPALQRSQRDTQRRNDYSMLSTAVTSYISNNGGKINKLVTRDPNTTLAANKWINADGTDPNGKTYSLVACSFSKWNSGGCGNGSAAGIGSGKWPSGASDQPSQVLIITGANCGNADSQGNSAPKADSGVRAFVVYGYLESGGFYCQANNATTN